MVREPGQYPRADQGDEGDIEISQREVSWRQRHAIVWDEELGIGRTLRRAQGDRERIGRKVDSATLL